MVSMKLRCPACGASGEVRGTEEAFEVRGQWPEGHWPVRKCRACGAGIIVKPGIGRARGKLIEPELWAKMEAHFEQEMARLRGERDSRAVSAAAEAQDHEDERAPSELERASDRL